MARKKARVLIFGASSGGSKFYQSCRAQYHVVGFLDNDPQKHGQLLFGKVIHSPLRIGELAFDQIIIASDYYPHIYQQLIGELAVGEEKISVSFHHFKRPGLLQRLRSRIKQLSLEAICRRPGLTSDLLYRCYFADHPEITRFALAWLDEAETHKVHVFREAQAGQVQGPRFLGREVEPTPITVPETALYAFRQGQVCANSRSIILPGGRLLAERVATAKIAQADLSSGHLVHHGESLALARQSATPDNIPRGVLITGFTETNYYHWVLEVLSQLQFVAELPAEYATYPVLISENSQNIPSIKAFIKALGISQPLLFLRSGASYCVDRLLLISSPNNGIYNYKGPAYCLAANNFARPESIEFLRKKGLALAAEVDPATLPKRVLLGRRGFLRPYNQAEVKARLEPLGFVCVYMEDQDIQHQVAIMANADIIVGPSGAAWTNILFASAGACALCWVAEEVGELSCFSNLADIVGVDMDYITYRADASTSGELYYKGYTIDAEAIERWAAAIDVTPAAQHRAA